MTSLKTIYCFLAISRGHHANSGMKGKGFHYLKNIKGRESSHFISVCKRAKKGRQTHFVYEIEKKDFWFSDS